MLRPIWANNKLFISSIKGILLSNSSRDPKKKNWLKKKQNQKEYHIKTGAEGGGAYLYKAS